MTTDQKLDLILRRQDAAFAHLQRRLNTIDARVQALITLLADEIVKNGLSELPVADLIREIDDVRSKLESRASEFGASLPPLPDEG